MGERHPNVIHTEEAPAMELGQLFGRSFEGTRFAARFRRLGAAAGGRKLGCTWHDVAPGKSAWPYHYHLGNEEAIYVLEGAGTLRIGPNEVPVRAGDYAALPVGSEGAHQMVNTSDAPLRYLCFSTLVDPEIVVYPDSKKVGAASMVQPGAVRMMVPQDAGIDYWTGEI
jgi:uncharacterized cupin superfamily protein